MNVIFMLFTRDIYIRSTHGIDQYTWIDIVQHVFSTTEFGGPVCFDRLKAAVSAVAAKGATPLGRLDLAKRMHLCSEKVLGVDPTNFLIDALETLPQEDYPYPIGSLPGWPVNATCRAAAAITDPLALAVNITDMCGILQPMSNSLRPRLKYTRYTLLCSRSPPRAQTGD